MVEKQISFLILVLFCVSFVSACDDGQIDINSASEEKLQELIGIGPVYAGRIIEARTFSSVDNLIDVSGIGAVSLEKIKQQGLACVVGETLAEEDEDEPEPEEETDVVIVDESEVIEDEPETALPISNENIINLNPQQEIEQAQDNTGEVIYESKNEKIKNKAIYFFAGFLIFIIVVLLIWR
tara:strand:+ start:7346 stop:7891 length:546 start_codon:yes stop_codon:yes gene_type:complete